MLFRYSRWDGSQNLADLDADDLLASMSDDLMSDGDLWNALRRMFQRGVQMPHGPQMPGLQNLLDRLRKRRQEQPCARSADPRSRVTRILSLGAQRRCHESKVKFSASVEAQLRHPTDSRSCEGPLGSETPSGR